jgi:hypothetical protein
VLQIFKQLHQKNTRSYIGKYMSKRRRKEKPQMIKKYYLPFNLAADVNYLYIFSLYDLAEYSKENKRRETIHYNSITGLADSLSISRSTLNRLLEKPDYKLFFSIDKEKKEILLYNNFGNDVKEKNFVVLTDEEVSFLRK